MDKKYGKIHKPKTLFLRDSIGTIKDDEGREYEATLNFGNKTPIIESKQTGKWFTLSWDDIVRIAITAGIDS